MERTCDELKLAWPCEVTEFLHSDVLADLTPEVRAAVVCATPDTRYDPAPFVAAVAALGLGSLSVASPLPNILRSNFHTLVRSDTTLRTFVDTCLAAGIAPETVVSDLRMGWNLNFDAPEIERYRELYFDRAMLADGGWVRYEACVGARTSEMMRGLARQPHDYVRWRLGIPVAPDSERALNRLMADAHYTERMIKANAGNMGIALSKDEMARIKMERDTMFKAMDRKMKQAELKAASGGGQDAVIETMSRLELKYASVEDENQQFGSLDDMQAENEALGVAEDSAPAVEA